MVSILLLLFQMALEQKKEDERESLKRLAEVVGTSGAAIVTMVRSLCRSRRSFKHFPEVHVVGLMEAHRTLRFLMQEQVAVQELYKVGAPRSQPRGQEDGGVLTPVERIHRWAMHEYVGELFGRTCRLDDPGSDHSLLNLWQHSSCCFHHKSTFQCGHWAMAA